MGPPKTKKKRVRKWTAEDRAVHREFEKSRREAFSERLMELAKLLPILKPEQRLSKHIIVDASISYHRSQQAQHVRASRALQALVTERDDLLREVNGLRALCQPGTGIPRQAGPVDPAVREMLGDPNEPAVDPAGGSGGSDVVGKRSELRPQRINNPGEAARPRQSPDAQQEKSVSMTSNGQISPPAGPFPTPGNHVSSSGDNGGPQDLVNWAGNASNKAIPPIPWHSNLMEGTALLWHPFPDPSMAPPPEAPGLAYYTNVSHLVDDAALFSSHPYMRTVTPPSDSALPYDASPADLMDDSSRLWPGPVVREFGEP